MARSRLTSFLLFLIGFILQSENASLFGQIDVPPGLSPLPVPATNPVNEAKIQLGKQLYFDPRLSVDNTVRCASCHDPSKGWSNGEATAAGVSGQRGNRNAPTIINAAYNRFQFWDGRAASLEEQALGPIANPIEMNLPIDQMVEKLNAIEGYRLAFQNVFGSDATAEHVANAIATFERTVLSGNAPYDRFKAGDTAVLSEQAHRGMKLFFGKANCTSCHTGPNLTDGGFHNIGIGMDQENPDQGRKAHSGLAGDLGAFKTPTLRDIAQTAPYMHDGSLATLEEVVQYYNRGGTDNPFLDEEIYPLKLNDDDVAALVQFLREGLTGDSLKIIEAPVLP